MPRRAARRSDGTAHAAGPHDRQRRCVRAPLCRSAGSGWNFSVRPPPRRGSWA